MIKHRGGKRAHTAASLKSSSRQQQQQQKKGQVEHGWEKKKKTKKNVFRYQTFGSLRCSSEKAVILGVRPQLRPMSGTVLDGCTSLYLPATWGCSSFHVGDPSRSLLPLTSPSFLPLNGPKQRPPGSPVKSLSRRTSSARVCIHGGAGRCYYGCLSCDAAHE